MKGIYINGRYVDSIYTMARPVIAVYINGQHVWPAIDFIKSCFSNGYWMDEYPWIDDNSWID